MRLIYLLLIACLISIVVTAQDQPDNPPKKTARMPVYVTPFYGSPTEDYDLTPPTIAVGPYSKKLSAATAETILDLMKEMKAEWDTLPIETMYVTAIRLYDLGLKDESVYWFHTATFRARMWRTIVAEDESGKVGNFTFRRMHAHHAFHRTAGIYINGYGFGDLPKMIKTLETVIEESEEIPDYQKTYPLPKYISFEDWEEKRGLVAEGYQELIKYMQENADEIKEKRKENGAEGKF